MFFFVVFFNALIIEATNSVCYPALGCFTNDASWYSVFFRPFNALPQPPSTVNTSFVLFTRDPPGQVRPPIALASFDSFIHLHSAAFSIAYVQSTSLNASLPYTIAKSNFKASRPTKFVIHGFLTNGTEAYLQLLINNLLIFGDFNVISVRWGGGSAPPYTQAVANTRLVGREIAILVNTLVVSFSRFCPTTITKRVLR